MSTMVLHAPVAPPASRADEAIIGLLFGHIDARNWRALATLFADDVTYERPGYPVLRGRARVMRFYRHERMIASGRHEVHRTVVCGDAAACWGRFRGVLKSGAPVDIRFADTYRFTAGRIVFRTSYFFVPAV